MKSKWISTRLSNFNGQSLCIAAILIFVSAGSSTASFDCKKAKIETEKIICSSPALSKLDQELAKAYRSALVKDFDKAQFQKDQRNWLKWRDFGQCATEITCLEEHYRNRLIEIASRSFCRDVKKKLETARIQPLLRFTEPEHKALPGNFSAEYTGLDIDKDGKPDKIVKDCGAQECQLQIELATGDAWDKNLTYPISISSFQSRILVIANENANANMSPVEDRKNHRSIEEITPSKLQSLCPAI